MPLLNRILFFFSFFSSDKLETEWEFNGILFKFVLLKTVFKMGSQTLNLGLMVTFSRRERYMVRKRLLKDLRLCGFISQAE